MKKFIASFFLSLTLFTAVAGLATLALPQPAYAQTNASNQLGESDKDPYSYCPSFLSGALFGSMVCNIGLLIIYTIFFKFTNFLASITAGIADTSVWLSLQSSIYNVGSMMTNGWLIVRDLMNVGFILALLVFGFFLIIGKSEANGKLFAKIIISALLVNFSLFGARFIIDLGNISARAIYTHIKVTDVSGNIAATDASSGGKSNISAAILSKTNPQKWLFTKVTPEDEATDFYAVALFVFFLGAIFNIMLMFMFLTMAVLFLSRTVGLILMAILVPIAIVIDLIPPAKAAVKSGAGSAGKLLSFESWFSEFFKMAVMPVVYVFFLYIILNLTNAAGANLFNVNLYGDTAQGFTGLITTAITASLPIVIMFFMMKMVTKLTETFSGTLGSMVTGAIMKGVQLLGGAAMAATAWGASRAGGRAGIGLAGSALDETQQAALREKGGLYNRLRANSRLNQTLAQSGKYLAKDATYDYRNLDITKTLAKTPYLSKIPGFQSGITQLGGAINKYGIAETGVGAKLSFAGSFEGSKNQTYWNRMENRTKEYEEKINAESKTMNEAIEINAEMKKLKSKDIRRNKLTAGDIKKEEDKIDAKIKAYEKGETDYNELLKQSNSNFNPNERIKFRDLINQIKTRESNPLLKSKADIDLTNQLKDQMMGMASVASERNISTMRKDATDAQKNWEGDSHNQTLFNAAEDAKLKVKDLENRKEILDFQRQYGGVISVENLQIKANDMKVNIPDMERAYNADNEKHLQRSKIELGKPGGYRDTEERQRKKVELEATKAKIDSTKAELKNTENSIEKRKEKVAELRADKANRNYLDTNSEAESDIASLKKMKERLKTEKDTDQIKMLLDGINHMSDRIEKSNKANGAIYESAVLNALANQKDLDKELNLELLKRETLQHMQDYWTGDVITNMKNAVRDGVKAAAPALALGLLGGLPAMGVVAVGAATYAIGKEALIQLRNRTKNRGIDTFPNTRMDALRDKLNMP